MTVTIYNYYCLFVTEWHEKGFIGFVISAEIYMITTIVLCRWRRTLSNFSAIVNTCCFVPFYCIKFCVNKCTSINSQTGLASLLQSSWTYRDFLDMSLWLSKLELISFSEHISYERRRGKNKLLLEPQLSVISVLIFQLQFNVFSSS